MNFTFSTVRAAIVAVTIAPGLFFCNPAVRADEQTRRAQEELRKRNLYFGDINGQMNRELTEALKRYQTRKGFNSSLTADRAGEICRDSPRA